MRDNASMPLMPDGGTGELNRIAGSSREDRVRASAYERYLQRLRSGTEGSAAGDWAAAERDLGAAPVTIPGKS